MIMPGKDETNRMKNPPMPDSSPDGREHAAEDEQWVRGSRTPMQYQGVSRRTLLKDGVAALAGVTVLRGAGAARGCPGHSGEGDAIAWDDAQPDPADAMAHQGEEVIPWVDQPA